MIDFKYPEFSQKEEYDCVLHQFAGRGCEYNFANLCLWGRQRIAFHQGNIAFFSQYDRKSVYPFPLGENLKPTLDAIIHDAKVRDIPCRLTGLSQEDCATLERLYPGQFRIHFARDTFDYVYDITDLSELKGRKYQKKRNHINRFRQNCAYTLEPITDENTPQVEQLLKDWYTQREENDALADFHMEKAAIFKALRNRKELQMEGLLMKVDGKAVAMTMGSRMYPDIVDVHFEKALDEADGAYPTINCEFARYLHEKYPDLQFLNREDDMGLEGLRKAKLSYCPHHMVEKNWACLLEDGHDY